ncbi:MAG: hypothetical protein KDI68_06695 [Gammaproteobacteria bacterium]|nr:hypothetical protein [Gammaproteobacteria bacterium]
MSVLYPVPDRQRTAALFLLVSILAAAPWSGVRATEFDWNAPVGAAFGTASDPLGSASGTLQLGGRLTGAAARRGRPPRRRSTA